MEENVMQKAIEKLMKLKPDLAPIIVYQGGWFTVARVEIKFNGEVFAAEGIARRSHLDEPNDNTGQEIASGRALKALAKKVICHKPVRHKFMG
jgi:hypothetical protein